MKTIIKWLLTIILVAISIAGVAIVASMAVLYGAMYLLIAMVNYGTQPVLITVAGTIGFILLIIIIRKAINHRRKKVYKYGR